MAVTLPSMSEFVDAIPEADPVLAYQVGRVWGVWTVLG